MVILSLEIWNLFCTNFLGLHFLVLFMPLQWKNATGKRLKYCSWCPSTNTFEPLFESAVFFVLLFETHIHRNQDRINDCFYFIQSFLFFKFLSLDWNMSQYSWRRFKRSKILLPSVISNISFLACSYNIKPSLWQTKMNCNEALYVSVSKGYTKHFIILFRSYKC